MAIANNRENELTFEAVVENISSNSKTYNLKNRCST